MLFEYKCVMDREPAKVDMSIALVLTKMYHYLTPQDTLETDVQDLTPSRINRILPRSPSSPRNNSELTVSRRESVIMKS